MRTAGLPDSRLPDICDRHAERFPFLFCIKHTACTIDI